MSKICILVGSEPKTSQSIVQKYFETQAKEYEIGVFFGIKDNGFLISELSNRSFICSLADNYENDNCEMLLLSDSNYYNGFTNLIPFVWRMKALSKIIEGAFTYFDKIELFIGDIGENTIDQFDPCHISVNSFVDFMDDKFNNNDFSAFHLYIDK